MWEKPFAESHLQLASVLTPSSHLTQWMCPNMGHVEAVPQTVSITAAL